MIGMALPQLGVRSRQAAKILGISERTLAKWVADGSVPCVRVGNGKRRVALFSVDELRSWLASGNQTKSTTTK